MRIIFDWLCGIVRSMRRGKSYLILMKVLYKTQFYILIGDDMNRCSDGVQLRFEYSEEVGGRCRLDISEPCSVLEMLVALARRMDYEISDEEYERTSLYFWEMIDNLGLLNCDDTSYGSVRGTGTYVKETLKRFMDRDYRYSGEGGLFPLRNPKRDQRDVSIWYQMGAYLYENYER